MAAVPPPGMGDALVPLFSTVASEIGEKALSIWPALLPFVLLRVAFGLLEWWLERRDRRSKPEQLSLF